MSRLDKHSKAQGMRAFFTAPPQGMRACQMRGPIERHEICPIGLFLAARGSEELQSFCKPAAATHKSS